MIEGYQVYLECRKWAKKEPADITEQTAQFKKEVQKHLSNIGLHTGLHNWKVWQSNFLGLLVGNNVFPLVENIELTELFRTKEFFHKLLIGQLTKTATEQKKKRTPSKDAQRDAHEFTKKKSDDGSLASSTSASWWKNVTVGLANIQEWINSTRARQYMYGKKPSENG